RNGRAASRAADLAPVPWALRLNRVASSACALCGFTPLASAPSSSSTITVLFSDRKPPTRQGVVKAKSRCRVVCRPIQ
uniref:Uncharacterized protein n=1 Tax=Anopheles albimanus TaxID=7167 RepID=A0A182FX05_ANOAL